MSEPVASHTHCTPLARRSLRRAALAIAVLASLAAPARAQARVGSFVDGERPMYLEVSPFIEGQPVHLELRNAPAGAKNPLLIWSFGYSRVDLTPLGIPGHLGPDLAQGGLVDLDPTTLAYDDVLPTGLAGSVVYLQAYVKLKGGGRLGSMTVAHVTAPGDDPGPTPTVQFPLPLTVEEVVPWNVAGFARVHEPVRVGLPLPIGEVAEGSDGVPQLTLTGGANEAQFSTLARWPDGSVKWALCEWFADLPAGGSSRAFAVDKGSGNFGGPDLATQAGALITVDTGVVQVELDPSTPDLFERFDLQGQPLLDLARGNGPHYWDDQDVEWTWHETAASVRRNGPVRAEIEVDGCFTRSSSASDPDRVLVRFYVELWKGSGAVRITASLRATALSFPEHLLFRGFTWRAFLAGGAPYAIAFPQAVSGGPPPGLWSGTLASAADDASTHQGFAKLKKLDLTDDPNAAPYVPFIERFADDDFAMEGVRTRIGATYFTGTSASGWRTAENVFADPTFMELNAAGGAGVLVGVELAKCTWPLELQSAGDGRFEVGLLPRKEAADTFHYPLTYASAETRVFWLLAEPAPAAAPITIAAAFDFPIGARADLHVYNQSQVWPWRLVSETELSSYAAANGLPAPAAVTTDLARTVFEYSNATGADSNNWEETVWFHRWLRRGDGGAHLRSLMEAYYKADKVAWSIDDGPLSARSKVRNGRARVTDKFDYYNNSKHTYWQVVADWALARGDSYLLDSGKAMAETLQASAISPNVQPFGNFVPGTYGAAVDAACAVLAYHSDPALEGWTYEICSQWANVVFKVDNGFGVDTTTLGWQAPIGTPPGSAANPDGYMITWDAGKATDNAAWGYTTQGWTDVRNGAQAFTTVVHGLRELAPGDPLLGELLARGEDWYHYAHRSIRDDHQKQTGDLFNIDVFDGDAGDPDVDPFAPPGFDIDDDDASSYALQAIVNLKLEREPSCSAFSYGVEMHRSIDKDFYDPLADDPILNDFVWRWLVHHGLLKP